MAVIGTFGSFTTARLALYASQASLNVTGNNIANINTTGYTRQRMDLVSLNSTGAPKYANNFMVDIGYGVLCERTTQLRDPFLDIRYRDKNSQLGQVEFWQNGLDQIASILDEVARGDDDYGIIEAQLGDFFKSMQDMLNRVGIDNYDELARSSADTLCQLINNAAKDVEGLLEKQEGLLKDNLSKANTLLTEIRDLNKQIREHSIYGDTALELRDARNVALDELSKLMHINVEYSMEKLDQYTEVEKLTVTLADSGYPPIKLVDGVYGTQIGIKQVPEENLNPKRDISQPNSAANPWYLDDNGDPTDVKWYLDQQGKPTTVEDDAKLVNNEKYLMQLQPLKDENGRFMRDEHDVEITDPVDLDDVVMTGGLQAIRELLTEEGVYASEDDIAMDPDATTKRGIPYYMHALDSLAQKFAEVMNAANQMDPSLIYKGTIVANSDPVRKATFEGKNGNNVQVTLQDGVTVRDMTWEDVTDLPDDTDDILAWKAANREILKTQGVLDENYDYYNGGVLFSNRSDNNDPTGITAKNISVSAGWLNGTTRMLRTKQSKMDLKDQSTMGDNIQHMITLYDKKMDYMPKDVQADAKSKLPFFNGSFREYFDNVSGVLAADMQVSNATYINYSTEVLDLENSRQSVSGVDLNEEATSMMQFSKSYSAACRLLTTLDSMLDKLINGTAV